MSGPPDQEEALGGGNMTTVTRVGDTVRRASGPWTPTIQRLLVHARANGVDWVPEPFGVDEAGREVLSFIPGHVPHNLPEWIWADHVLVDVARALRQWHDATAGFSAPDAPWRLSPPGPREVICHNDFAPYNCVFREGRFVGAIDFDMCAPGARLWDLAYTAYRFIPLMPGPDATAGASGYERSPFEGAAMTVRMELLLASYGAVGAGLHYGHAQLVGAVIDRLNAIASWTEDHVRHSGVAALAAHPALYRSHAHWLASWRGGG